MYDFTDIAFMTGIVMAISEFLKQYMNKKFIPIVTMALGILSGLVYVSPADPRAAILSGIIIGLSANGLYSGAKNLSQGFQGFLSKKEV